MTDLQFLLSDEFVEFSTKIGDVHQRIKDLKAKFQADMKGLREEADILQKGFETWQNSQLKSPGKALEDAAKAKTAEDAKKASAPLKQGS